MITNKRKEKKMIIYIVNDEYNAEVYICRNLKEAKRTKSRCWNPNAVRIKKIDVPRNKDGVIWAMRCVPR
tara:strand:+ start:784 stop:993 length:210 start_codon:yes stop_codon:yes gene_type:complete